MGTHRYTRREFADIVGAGIVAAAVPQYTASAARLPGERPPNILVIMSDEHHAGVLGCMGNYVIRTPHLDGLADTGITLEHCYCNSPLCVPSRLSFTSGKYVSRVGAWSNACWLPSDEYPSLPRVVRAAGYQPFLCGKMHYDPTRRYGFTEIGGDMNHNQKTGAGKRRKADDLESSHELSNRFKEFRAEETSSVLQHDRKVTAGTIEFLKNRRRDEPPFMLLAGYLAPHFPLIVPQRYWDEYKGRVSMPPIPDGLIDGLPLNYQHLRVAFKMDNVPEDLVRKGRELYHGLVEWVDNEIGRVLATLADSDVAENTVVIYTSDHGENMGEHGLWWKNCLYDSAARVPLIVSWPARWKGGQRRTEVCSLVDVVQTIAALCDAETPEDWNGHSMTSWLDDSGASWKDHALSEYYGHNVASGITMFRQGRYKYVYHARPDDAHSDQRELFDLQGDPYELRNLAGDPDHADRVAAMHKALVREVGDDPNEVEQRCRADYARGYNRSA